MNAVGIIAEYNPLHNGHIYHIEEAREIAGSDAVVVAMSGDYVQRGEPAILSKWERTRLALINGADLVVEIPTLFCLGNAAQYAKAGVAMLESMLPVRYLSFGSESGNVDSLLLTAVNMDRAASEIEEGISKLIKEGVSYPAARARVYKELFPDAEDLPESPNDVLALEYVRASSRLEHLAVKRKGAAYNDNSSNDIFMSASGIREAVMSDESVIKYVPLDTAISLQESIITNPDKWVNTFKYAVISMDAEDIDRCPSGGEGLGNKIKSVINDFDDWNALIEAVKSKRYTYTRISRLFMQIILGIDRNKYISDMPQYLRILGMNDTGRELVKEMKNNELCDLPLITNINKQMDLLSDEGTKQLELDIHCADVYNLVTGRNQVECSDYRTKPILISL